MINRSDYVQTNNKQKNINLKISTKNLIGFFLLVYLKIDLFSLILLNK